MHILWGILMIGVGVFLFISGALKSNFVIYRLLVERSKRLWGKNVYLFHQISGALIVLVGVLLLFKII